MDIVQQIRTEVDRYWSEDVEVLGAWSDCDGSTAWIIYRRRLDPLTILGHRFAFSTDAADGTIEGFVRDAAINLVEPVGGARTWGPDEHGVVWVGLGGMHSTPAVPSNVIERIVEALR